MKAQKNFIGLEGFIWWVGVVEDRQDPEQLNRVRVRCFGWHTEDKKRIPTNALPWAHPTIPVNSPAAYNPKEGDMVFGFFLDGDQAQNPIIVGVFPGKPDKKPNYENGFSDPGTTLSSRPKRPDDASEKYPKSKYLKEATTNRLARGKAEGTVIKTRKDNKTSGIKSAGGVTWSEPNPAFAPKYPYNYAHESESGHAFELDDTPEKERVHLAHRMGSFFEIDSQGSKVEKVVKDNYTLIMGSDHVYVSGKCSVTVDGDCNLRVGGNMNIEVAGQINMAAGDDIRIKGKNVMIESTGAFDVKSGAALNINAFNKLSLKGANTALQGEIVDIPAARINMQSGSAADATPTGLAGGQASPSSAAANIASNTAANTASAGGTGITGAIDTALTTTSKITSVVGAATNTVAGALSNVTSAISGSALGKAVGGLTSSVSGIVGDLGRTLDSTIGALQSVTLPLGEITARVTQTENLVNGLRGDILSLTGTERNTTLGKIDTVSTLASSKNIDFNIDQDITTAINVVKNVGVAAFETVTGKRLYPKTESVQVPSSNTG